MGSLERLANLLHSADDRLPPKRGLRTCRKGIERPSREIAKITPEFLNRGCFDCACSECAHIARVKHAKSVARIAQPCLLCRLRWGGHPPARTNRAAMPANKSILFPGIPVPPSRSSATTPFYHLGMEKVIGSDRSCPPITLMSASLHRSCHGRQSRLAWGDTRIGTPPKTRPNW